MGVCQRCENATNALPCGRNNTSEKGFRQNGEQVQMERRISIYGKKEMDNGESEPAELLP